MVNKQCIIITKDKFSFFRLLRALPLSATSVEFSLELVCPTMVGENVQIHSVKITEKCACESKKLNLEILTHALPRQNSLSGSYHHPSR